MESNYEGLVKKMNYGEACSFDRERGDRKRLAKIEASGKIRDFLHQISVDTLGRLVTQVSLNFR